MMKKLVFIVTTILFMAGFTASAQKGHEHDNNQSQEQGMMMQKSGMMQGGMMQGGMMKGMMCPMHQGMMGQQMSMKKYMMTVNLLPNMQSQMSLSQDQTEQLIDMQSSFKKQQVDYKADLAKKRMTLRNMMKNDASAGDIEKQMRECSTTKINMRVEAYETANKMKALLTDEQKEDLQDMMMQYYGMMKDVMPQEGMRKNMKNR